MTLLALARKMVMGENHSTSQFVRVLLRKVRHQHWEILWSTYIATRLHVGGFFMNCGFVSAENASFQPQHEGYYLQAILMNVTDSPFSTILGFGSSML